jgi:hypothetical protein
MSQPWQSKFEDADKTVADTLLNAMRTYFEKQHAKDPYKQENNNNKPNKKMSIHKIRQNQTAIPAAATPNAGAAAMAKDAVAEDNKAKDNRAPSKVRTPVPYPAMLATTGASAGLIALPRSKAVVVTPTHGAEELIERLMSMRTLLSKILKVEEISPRTLLITEFGLTTKRMRSHSITKPNKPSISRPAQMISAKPSLSSS